MAFPLAPIAILSMEVTRALVALGYGLGFDVSAYTASGNVAGRFTRTLNPATSLPWPSLSIVDCTGIGVTPIVVTTQYPHGVSARAEACGGLSCVIAGVGGNVAANHIDADTTSRTIGLSAGVLAVPLTSTTLALYGQEPIEGNIIPLVGSGNYTSGGTITPALTDGSILIGRAATREHSAAPRIVLVPQGVTSKFTSAASPNPSRRNEERRAEIRQRSIGVDSWTFAAHCWGSDTPPDEARDFTIAATLREVLRAALHDVARGASSMGAGSWDDQRERDAQHIKAGHLLSCAMSIDVPVTDNPLAGGLPFVPDTASIAASIYSETDLVATIDVGPLDPA